MSLGLDVWEHRDEGRPYWLVWDGKTNRLGITLNTAKPKYVFQFDLASELDDMKVGVQLCDLVSANSRHS